MGAQWLERNMALFVKHMVTLAANPRSSQTHIDAVYARKCIVFIMSSSVQGMLGEKAQVNAAKELAKVIAKEMEVMSEFSMFEFYLKFDSNTPSNIVDIMSGCKMKTMSHRIDVHQS